MQLRLVDLKSAKIFVYDLETDERMNRFLGSWNKSELLLIIKLLLTVYNWNYSHVVVDSSCTLDPCLSMLTFHSMNSEIRSLKLELYEHHQFSI